MYIVITRYIKWAETKMYLTLIGLKYSNKVGISLIPALCECDIYVHMDRDVWKSKHVHAMFDICAIFWHVLVQCEMVNRLVQCSGVGVRERMTSFLVCATFMGGQSCSSLQIKSILPEMGCYLISFSWVPQPKPHHRVQQHDHMCNYLTLYNIVLTHHVCCLVDIIISVEWFMKAQCLKRL